MTNNLMARLRHWQQYGPYRPSRYKEAADRIEKLEAALRELSTDWDCCAVSKNMKLIARKALEGKDESN